MPCIEKLSDYRQTDKVTCRVASLLKNLQYYHYSLLCLYSTYMTVIAVHVHESYFV